MSKNDLEAELVLAEIEYIPLRRALMFMAFINVGKYLDLSKKLKLDTYSVLEIGQLTHSKLLNSQSFFKDRELLA